MFQIYIDLQILDHPVVKDGYKGHTSLTFHDLIVTLLIFFLFPNTALGFFHANVLKIAIFVIHSLLKMTF